MKIDMEIKERIKYEFSGNIIVKKHVTTTHVITTWWEPIMKHHINKKGVVMKSQLVLRKRKQRIEKILVKK